MTNQEFYNAPIFARQQEIKSWGGEMTEEEKAASAQWQLANQAEADRKWKELMQSYRDLPEAGPLTGYYVGKINATIDNKKDK